MNAPHKQQTCWFYPQVRPSRRCLQKKRVRYEKKNVVITTQYIKLWPSVRITIIMIINNNILYLYRAVHRRGKTVVDLVSPAKAGALGRDVIIIVVKRARRKYVYGSRRRRATAVAYRRLFEKFYHFFFKCSSDSQILNSDRPTPYLLSLGSDGREKVERRV